MNKPQAEGREARWFENHEAALLLESARTYVPDLGKGALPFPYALIGTLLLTGGRLSEVLGLEVDDVSLNRRTVTFRPNQWRGLKTKRSHRSVPLWRQLDEVLRQHMMKMEQGGGLRQLLFPAPGPGEERLLGDFRKSLDKSAVFRP